jgi:hypothetical protein
MAYRGGRKTGDYNKDSRVILEAVREFLKTHPRVTVRFCLYHVISLKLKHPKTGELIIPSSAEQHEIKFYGLLSRARVAGDIDDDPFEDNHSSVEHGGRRGWDSLLEYMEPPDVERYERNRWQDQPKHITEVWLEKDTLAVQVRPAVRKWDCTLRISTGCYGRAYLYKAARELHDVEKPIVILYCGDHDCGGLDIERAARKGNDKKGADRREGLEDILIKKFGWTPERFAKQVKWVRVAVTEDDLNNPLFAPFLLTVKQTRIDPKTKMEVLGDTRAPAYIAKYGDRGLQVEALEAFEPGLLARRLDRAIQKYGVDVAAWEASGRKQKREIHNWLRRIS